MLLTAKSTPMTVALLLMGNSETTPVNILPAHTKAAESIVDMAHYTTSGIQRRVMVDKIAFEIAYAQREEDSQTKALLVQARDTLLQVTKMPMMTDATYDRCIAILREVNHTYADLVEKVGLPKPEAAPAEEKEVVSEG